MHAVRLPSLYQVLESENGVVPLRVRSDSNCKQSTVLELLATLNYTRSLPIYLRASGKT